MKQQSPDQQARDDATRMLDRYVREDVQPRILAQLAQASDAFEAAMDNGCSEDIAAAVQELDRLRAILSY